MKLRRSRRTFDVLFTYGFRAAPWWMTVTLVIMVINGATMSALPWGYKQFTDAFLTHDSGKMTFAAIFVAVLGTLRWTSTGLSFSVGNSLTDKVNFYMTQRIARLTMSTEQIEHFERPAYLQELDLLNQNRATLASGPRQILVALQIALQLIGIAVLLATISPWLALMPVLGMAPFLTEQRSVRYRQRVDEQLAEKRRLAGRLFELTSTAAPAKELRVFGLSPEIRRRHRELTDELCAATDRAALVSGAIASAGWVVFAVGLFAGIGYVVLKAVDGTASPGQVILAATLTQQIRFQLSQVADAIGTVLTMAKTAHRYLWLQDYAAEHNQAPTDATQQTPPQLQHGLTFDHVTFRYPGTSTDVLTDVCLTLPAGATVALVGENGAGKTTLIKLLTRMYLPTTGAITIDGVDLQDLEAADWRGHVTATFQDFVRFELLAREAVGIGDLPNIDDADAISRALERANATDVEAVLADGLMTRLGRSFPGGQELSGGQWQKLALARGMMRNQPLLVVLDEPTASLDPQTEHALFERYAQAARRAAQTNGAITVLVSHRFSTVRMADLIVVIDRGRVVEHGSHQQLMTSGGLYAELFTLQARAYR